VHMVSAGEVFAEVRRWLGDDHAVAR